MKCLDPILCHTTPQGKRLFRHFSIASRSIKILHQQVFNCGKCIFCRKKKSLELAVRCVLHSSLYEQNCFITLTYDETRSDYHNRMQYSDIQKFKKRLRQYCRRNFNNKKVEIFNVHEYGKNQKKHWHLIIFNHDFADKIKFKTNKGNTIYTSKTLEDLWPYGFNTIGDVTEASAMYQSQYMQKDIKNNNLSNFRKSKSNHSGIGRDYFLKYYNQILRLGYIPFQGKKIPIPRYFVEHIAKKHWAHFYEPTLFFKTIDRKPQFRPFKQGKENKELADLYLVYKEMKEEKIKELENDWNKTIEKYLTTNEKPDFIKSAENYLYDLKNKETTKHERF